MLKVYVDKILVRAALAGTVIFSFSRFSKTLEEIFGPRWIQWFFAITVTQSHFMFYLSRTLPNTFALPLGEKVLCTLFELIINIVLFTIYYYSTICSACMAQRTSCPIPVVFWSCHFNIPI